ncbi:MAG: rhomboid family intramembrane serine protease [Halobacteriales archaeon]
MAECDYCGTEEDLPYECRHCGGTFCAEHRLPENHDCPGLDDWSESEQVFASSFDDTVRDDLRGGSGGLADRLGIDTGPGGALAYFRGNVTFLFLGLMWGTFALQWIVLTLAGASVHQTLFILTSERVFYVWTWVTSVFAHSPVGFAHIAFNSIALYFFGPIVERRVGSKAFAALFLMAGAVAGLSQVGVAILTNETAAVLGASGAVMAVLGVLTVLNPNLRVYLWFVLPMPLWVLTIGFALLSLVFVGAGGIGAGNVAHLAHLSGLGIGLLYGEHVKRQGTRAPEQIRFGGGGGPGGPGGPGGRRRF